MTATELATIKEKIETAKQKKSKAEGALERIESTLKTEYGVNSFEEAEELLTKLDKEATAAEERAADLETELKELTNWDAI